MGIHRSNPKRDSSGLKRKRTSGFISPRSRFGLVWPFPLVLVVFSEKSASTPEKERATVRPRRLGFQYCFPRDQSSRMPVVSARWIRIGKRRMSFIIRP